MTQLFGEDGTVTPVTVIQAGPCVVTQKKTVETDGYAATQIAFGDVKPSKLNKPLLGHLKKAGVVAQEAPGTRCRGEDDLAAGRHEVTVEAFSPGDPIKVTGVSKGKGFQGVIKRHNFKGGPGGSRRALPPRSRLHRRVGRPGAGLPGHPASGSDGQRRR